MYEPARPGQRFQQLVCSQNRAIVIVCGAAVFVIVIALIAAFARPSSSSLDGSQCALTTEAPPPDKKDDGLATNGEKFPWTDIRLPSHIKPLEYDLFLHPDLNTFLFKGQVGITLKAEDTKDFLIFHMKHLNYTTIVLAEKKGGKVLENVKVLEYPAYEQVYLQTKQQLQKDKSYVLTISFNGELSDSLVGFYKSSYTTKAGEKR